VFVALLKDKHIAAIADVRSTPYSRLRPQFNQPTLQSSLAKHGDEHGRIQYRSLAESAAFREGLRRVRAGSERMRIALMCAESEPLDCHRGILISRHLVAHGTQVLHIHTDGRLETHREVERRLLRLWNLHDPDLFRTQDQILAEAYERQEARTAYVMPNAMAEHKVVR
jgi:hypothetical protein